MPCKRFVAHSDHGVRPVRCHAAGCCCRPCWQPSLLMMSARPGSSHSPCVIANPLCCHLIERTSPPPSRGARALILCYECRVCHTVCVELWALTRRPLTPGGHTSQGVASATTVSGCVAAAWCMACDACVALAMHPCRSPGAWQVLVPLEPAFPSCWGLRLAGLAMGWGCGRMVGTHACPKCTVRPTTPDQACLCGDHGVQPVGCGRGCAYLFICGPQQAQYCFFERTGMHQEVCVPGCVGTAAFVKP